MHPAPSGPLPRAYWRVGSTAQITATTVGGVLRSAASRAPDRIALVFGEQRWTYADLRTEAEDAARGLLARFDPGDVVAIWADNCAEWVKLEFAAALSGLTLVPLRSSSGPEEIADAIAHSGAKGIFLETDGGTSSRIAILRSVKYRLPSLKFVIPLSEWDTMRGMGSPDLARSVTSLPEVDPDSPAQILYTSGTTGQPKAAILTHRGLTNSARLAAAAFGARADDVVVNPMPLSHVAGCGLITLGIAQFDGTHVLMPRFDPALQLSLIEEHRGTLLCGHPTMLATTQGHVSFGTRNLRSVRAVVSCGAQIPLDLALDIGAALGVPVLTALAQTECGGAITATTPEDTLADRLGGVGRPLPGTEVKIIDPRTGVTTGCGVIGEICVRGYQVMRGYLDDPVATAAAFGSDCWLHTGDLGAMDDRGYLRVVGRLREMIVLPPQERRARALEDIDF
jgi:fatty-acyl-CoA synthase